MLRFIYLQYMRTDAASRKSAEMARIMRDVPGSDLPPVDTRTALKAAVQLAMHHFAESMAIVDDLKVCIVRNLTDRSFFTSDDPAVLTNRLHIQKGNKFSKKFGVKTAGAIFILPLSPQLCAIAYDPGVYHSSQKNGWINVCRKSDIDCINEHQILKCSANLYYKQWEQSEYIMRHIIDCRSRRLVSRHNILHAVLDCRTEWGSRYIVRDVVDLREEDEVLVHIVENHPEPYAWPSFLRFRPDAKAYSNNTGAGLTRKWCLDKGFVTGSGYRKIRV